MVGKFEGTLIGYRTYDKKVKDEKGNVTESKPQYIYDVLCCGVKRDKDTGLYIDECKIVSVVEDEPALETMEYGMGVGFYGETVEFQKKDGRQTVMHYFGICALDIKGGKA